MEFEGSNHGGRTWRSFEFRFKAQHDDRIWRHVAPWFDRFKAGLQLAFNGPQTTVIPRVAALLIQRNPDVMALFRGDPFPDRPPAMVRMPVHRFSFTDLATCSRTGNFWRKEHLGDYALPIYLNERGHLDQGPLEGAR